MKLLEEHDGPMLIRVTDCGCGGGRECETSFVFASAPPWRDQLWITSGVGPADQVGEQVQWLLANEAIEQEGVPFSGVRPLVLVAHALALVGTSWKSIVEGGRPRALAQFEAFDGAPDWMLRVPLVEVRRVRGVCFGDDVTRVPRALQALKDAYDPGGRPVARGDLRG